MILKKITLKNFLSYADCAQEIVFEVPSIVCLSGNNGHGKSALLESITWCLWGIARKTQGVTKNDESLMRIGSSHMFVSVVVSVKNISYLVVRSCEKKNKRVLSDLSLYVYNEYEDEEKKILLNGSSQKETQDIINEKLGIDYDMFVNTSFLRQGNSNEFSKKTPKERKELLAKILNVYKIEELREKILVDVRKQEQEIILLERQKGSMPQLNYELLENKINVVNEKKRIYEEEKNKATIIELEIKNYDILYKSYVDEMVFLDEKYKKTTQEIHTLLSLFKKNNYVYAMHKKIYFDCCALDSTIHTLKKSIFNFSSENTAQDFECSIKDKIKERDEIMKKYYTLEGCVDTYFFIDQEWNSIQEISKKKCLCSSSKILLERIHCKKIENKNSIEECILKTKQLNSSIEELQKKQQEIIVTNTNTQDIKKHNEVKISVLHEQYETLQKQNISLVEFKKLRQQIKEIIHSIRMSQKQLLSLEESKKKLFSGDGSVIETKKKQVREYEVQLQLRYKEIVELETTIQFTKKQYEELEKTKKDLENTIVEFKKQYEIYNNLVILLNRDNLQASLIDHYVPIIEHEANTILNVLSDGKSSLMIESTRDLKSGKSKETLDIIIVDGAGARPYEFFSGGEAFRIDLAIRIGLSKVLAKQAGVNLKTLIIDEGFGSQDTISLEIVMQSLYKLQDDFDLIVLVSHLTSMKNEFPYQLLVQKTHKGTIITGQ